MGVNGRSCSFLLGVILCAALHGSAALRGVHIRVPEAVAAGETVKLACDYDLEQAALYSIKWYRGDQEFYRFVPKESPPTRVFPQGIRVDISQSNAREVTLRDVQRDLTGFYKCEVSADAPLFHTEIKSALMIVAVLPTDKPKVSVEKIKYSQGERIRANCSSPAAYPAVNLTWFLNGKEVWSSPPQVRVSPALVEAVGSGGLEAARGAVDLEASSAMFPEGRARLRCLATLFTLYRRTDEVELTEDTPQIAPVMGPTAPHSLDFACRTAVSSYLNAVISLTLLLLLAAR